MEDPAAPIFRWKFPTQNLDFLSEPVPTTAAATAMGVGFTIAFVGMLLAPPLLARERRKGAKPS